MKSYIFSNAIANRNRVKFLYNLHEIVLEPYFISRNKNGKKVLYGKIIGSNQIMTFEFDRICNIKTFSFERFSPVIPIMASYN